MSPADRLAAAASALLYWLAAMGLLLLGLTWRVRFEGVNSFEDSGRPAAIGATWHRNLFIAAVLFRRRGIAVPVSRSRDGERISALLRRLGFADPPRGSSSRGGASALRQLARGVAEGVSAVILTDGPKGPARRSKDGAISLARWTGVPITPASFSARPCLRVGSWDASLIPWPFARVTCRFGEAIPVARDASPDEEGALLARLDAELNRDTDALDDALRLRDPNRHVPRS